MTAPMDSMAPMAKDPAIEYTIQTRELNLWYGDFQALKHVDVSIRHGIITALIGPSGCGKTTFLRCSNRLNERYGNVRTTGEIRILRKNIYDPDVSLSELRKTVGMVFQRPNPLPISIYDNVVFGLRVHAEAQSLQRRELTLEQQQKLCIARLLPLKPRVILMDEPCSALDARGTMAIERLMDDLRGKFTIVIVTHNMAQARRVSDECIFMLLGEVIEHAPTPDLFLKPTRKETEMYVEGRYG
jgi:phosphate transport system ATP-binding protein